MNHQHDNPSVYTLLMQVMFQAKHAVNVIAEDYGISVMQANTLFMMTKGEPFAMNTLSAHFMCDASNVTGIVDRLEKQGLIERQDHPTDRRVKMLGLTAKGEAVRGHIMAKTMTAEAERMDPVLTSEERATLYLILEKLVANQGK